jgi:hypothetical protein
MAMPAMLEKTANRLIIRHKSNRLSTDSGIAARQSLRRISLGPTFFSTQVLNIIRVISRTRGIDTSEISNPAWISVNWIPFHLASPEPVSQYISKTAKGQVMSKVFQDLERIPKSGRLGSPH